MRDLGAQAAPQNAFLLNLGLKLWHLRMERHCSNAQAVAEFWRIIQKWNGLTIRSKSNLYYELALKIYAKR